jgi:hypothetical protein
MLESDCGLAAIILVPTNVRPDYTFSDEERL